MDSCDTGFDLIDDKFCYSHCSNFYNGECYSCDEGYYRVVKKSSSILTYYCLPKDDCVTNGLKIVKSLRECYEICPTTMYSPPNESECVFCYPDCASYATN